MAKMHEGLGGEVWRAEKRTGIFFSARMVLDAGRSLVSALAT